MRVQERRSVVCAVCTHMCTRTRAFMLAYLCVYARASVCVCVYARVCVFVCIRVCVCVCVCLFV